MASVAYNARTAFLEKAAQAYAKIDPATSAHLMTERNMNTSDNGKSSCQKMSCRACGTILVPGLTSRTSISPVRQRTKSNKVKKLKTKQVIPKSIRLVCLRCGSYSKYPLPQIHQLPEVAVPARKVPSRPNLESKMIGKPDSLIGTRKLATSNAGSRQRAKSRKGGLQAMLEKSKQSVPSPMNSGLDLMDILKQG